MNKKFHKFSHESLNKSKSLSICQLKRQQHQCYAFIVFSFMKFMYTFGTIKNMPNLCQSVVLIVQVMGTNSPEHDAPLSKFLRPIFILFSNGIRNCWSEHQRIIKKLFLKIIRLLFKICILELQFLVNFYPLVWT